MAQRKITDTIDRFRYSPGDGHVYVWQAGRDVITVNRIIQPGTSGMYLRSTGDTIPAPEQATATTMADTVDQWRAGRVTGAVPAPQP